MIVVKLDSVRYPAGPATVIAIVSTVAEFIALADDRDGARKPDLRLWAYEGASVGDRVKLP